MDLMLTCNSTIEDNSKQNLNNITASHSHRTYQSGCMNNANVERSTLADSSPFGA